jgi:hypothetical protein
MGRFSGAMKRPALKLVWAALLIAVVAGLGLLAKAQQQRIPSGTWAPMATIGALPAGTAACALGDGRIVVAGGSLADGAVSNTVAIFDPATALWVNAGTMLAARTGHAIAAMKDGRVLIADGADASGELASAEIFYPATGAFVPSVGVMSVPPSGHVALRLAHNNAVLIAGGQSAGAPVNSAELYFSWTDGFSETGSMADARAGAVGVPIPGDGLAGVASGSGLSSAEAYGFATVKTDKDDYAPGETVVITGSGWEPNEPVMWKLEEVSAPPGGTYGGTTNLSTTLTKTTGGSPVSGKTVSFTLNGTPVGNATTDSIGVATLRNVSLAGISANTYPGSVAASFAGDASYAASSGSNTLTVGKASSATVVICTAGPFTYNGSAQTPCTVSVTGAGGLTLTPDPTYVNNINAGPATASYTYAGDANHTGSSDSKTFTIDKASSTTVVTVAGGESFTYDSNAHPATVAVIGVDGLNLTPDPVYSFGHAPINAADSGSTASYAFGGDANHAGSSDSKTYTIARAPSTTVVTFETGSYVYRGTAFTASAAVTGAGRLNQSLTVNYLNNVVGTATAGATFAGDTNHSGSSDSKTFSILYASTGTCLGSSGHAILQPVNADGTSVFKQKSTVPAKFRVCDANGNSIGTPGVVSNFRLVQIINGTTQDVDEAVVSTTPDAAFRWAATDQQWIFNMNTKNLAANATYLYRITLNDGSAIDFRFGLK